MKLPPFSDEEIERYSRQILLREVGGRGQRCLLSAAPILLCTDGVGELAACYLRRAGVVQLQVFAPAARVPALCERLRDEGPQSVAPPPAPPPAPLEQAPPHLATLLEQAPGFTLLSLGREGADDDLLFASCSADRGVVGSGLALLLDEVRAADRADAPGDATMLIGSALALLCLQRLLGLSTPRRLQIDANRAGVPWQSAGGAD